MPTTQEEKPAKPRQRSRKAAETRKAKAAPPTQVLPEQVAPEAEPVSVALEPVEAELVEATQIEATAAEAVPVTIEKPAETALSGEVLLPEVRDPVTAVAGPADFVLVLGDYTRNSWAARRLLVERLMAARSFGEVMEIQGEFARQAYANFVTQSQRISVLYGEWAQQFFRPFDELAGPRTRTVR
jgi:hypothetical protein